MSTSKLDGLVKSRKSPITHHSGLSGIVSLRDVIWQHDSRQAGMTTFYKFIKLSSALVLMAVVVFVARTASSGPNLGREVKPEEIAAWDITVPPDGSGLPPGSGTAAEGGAIYNAKCAGCHGVKGIGRPADRLVGGMGTLTSKKPAKTVGSYWPYAPVLFDN